MAKSYKKDELQGKTNIELKQICKRMEIKGMSKKRKSILVNAILLAQSGKSSGGKSELTKKTIGKTSSKDSQVNLGKDPNKVVAATFTINSVIDKPNAKFGNRNKSTIMIEISSGASGGKFPVNGKSIFGIKSHLSEVLNIPKMSSAVVNGKQAEESYIAKEGDIIEFIKPAGKKG